MNAYQKLRQCLESVRKRTDFCPQVALVLGSGLGSFAEDVEAAYTLPYGEIEGFPVSTVDMHKGQFVFGRLGGVPVVVMQGRVHYYEGYGIQDVVLPARLMGLLGAGTLFLTNAAGAANPGYAAGDLMLIADQIASFIPSPLRGGNIDELGVRFPDMTEIYDTGLRAVVRAAAQELGVSLREGVYMQLPGPQFESPAEVRMCRSLGADAVGMSTACEAIAARHMGLRVVGVSCISNLCAGLSAQQLTAQEVGDTAAQVAPRFRALIREAVRVIGEGGA